MKTRVWKLAITSSLFVAAALAASGCGGSDESDDFASLGGQSPYPNIHGGDVKGDKNFADLINKYPEAKGNLGWAAYWWPYTGNGIASGEYGGGGEHGGGFSPAAKYDAAHGNQTQAQQWEIKNHGAGVPKVQGWWGHCNGWCAASSLLPEPREPVTVNGIEFGVADLKGLLAEAGMSVDADFYGNRVDPWTEGDERRWEDTVPNQYFLVLTNYMAKAGRTVLIDRYTGDQIWNQPLAGYRIQYPTAADYLGCSNNVCKINVRSTVWWYNDSGVPATVISPDFKYDDETDPNSGAEVVQHRDMEMEVWLDGPVEFGPDGKITKSGDVIVTHDGDYFAGGAWKMGYHNVDGNPDYMWLPYSFAKPDPSDDYGNPYIDIEWIKAHLLVPGGLDDPSVHAGSIATAPSPHPGDSGDHPTSPTNPTTPSNPGHNSNPNSNPNSSPNSNPNSNPWPTRTTVPNTNPWPPTQPGDSNPWPTSLPTTTWPPSLPTSLPDQPLPTSQPVPLPTSLPDSGSAPFPVPTPHHGHWW